LARVRDKRLFREQNDRRLPSNCRCSNAFSIRKPTVAAVLAPVALTQTDESLLAFRIAILSSIVEKSVLDPK